MPITRPSDKGQEDAQWWKEQELPEGEIPEGPAANNHNNAGKNKFEEEQHPVRKPGD